MSEVLKAGNHDLYVHGKFRLWLRFWQGPNFPRSLRDFDWLAIGKQSMGRGYVCDDYVWVIHIVVQLKGGVQVSTNALCVESSPHISGSGPTLFSTGSMVQINDLPVEVLSWALKIAVEYLVAGWPMYAFELAGLRSVCRYWNDVLLGDSTLWCRLYIDPWTPMQRVEKWIERSRGCSLFIYLNITRGWPSAAIVPSLSYSPSAFVDAVFDIIGASFRWNLVELRLQDMWDPIDVCQSELYVVLKSVPRLTRLHLIFVDCIAFEDAAVETPVLARAAARARCHGSTAPVDGVPCPFRQTFFIHSDGPLKHGRDGRPTAAVFPHSEMLIRGNQSYIDTHEIKFQPTRVPFNTRYGRAVDRPVPSGFFSTTPRAVNRRPLPSRQRAAALVLADLIHLEFTPVSVGSCRLLGRIAMPKLETLVLSIHPSQLVVPVVSICGPAFRTVAIAASIIATLF
ncbi:hypothetical protein C8J57DRAFT_1226323 [Mycena rebaudengoi]|nr:hypothetical protein C8J57DRAFT_1226323 [Mycena rebaudengoi]